jgi:8-oxo-dGTP pyrophosphatase MutT (NUDIX family)
VTPESEALDVALREAAALPLSRRAAAFLALASGASVWSTQLTLEFGHLDAAEANYLRPLYSLLAVGADRPPPGALPYLGFRETSANNPARSSEAVVAFVVRHHEDHPLVAITRRSLWNGHNRTPMRGALEWVLPGGAIDVGETGVQAITREISEELFAGSSADIAITDLPGRHVTEAGFVVRYFIGAVQVESYSPDRREIDEVAEVPIESLFTAVPKSRARLRTHYGNDKQVAAVSTMRSIEYDLTSSVTAWGAMATGIDLLRSHVPNHDRLLELLYR